jgi:hypothetical protein
MGGEGMLAGQRIQQGWIGSQTLGLGCSLF